MQGNTNAIIASSSGGSSVTVSAINKTGSTITTGSKVWLNENQQTQGSSYQLGNSSGAIIGAIDRTGLFGVYDKKFYNINTDSATLIGNAPNNTYLDLNKITYMADNSVFANDTYAYRVDGNVQWVYVDGVGLGDDIFINRNNNSINQLDMSNSNIINTFTNSDTTYLNSHSNLIKVGNYIYRVSGNAKYKWFLDCENLTVTRSSYTFTNAPYQYDIIPAGVTADNKYILCSQSQPVDSNNNYLWMVEVLEDGNLRGLTQSEMPVDMQKWFSTKCSFVFNTYTGILTVNEYRGSDYGIYKYENGTWTQLPIDLGLAEGTQLAGAITVSDDLTRACYGYYYSGTFVYQPAKIVNLETTSGYAAVPYRFYNVTENTITGYAGNDTEPNNEVVVGIASVQ